MNAIFSYLVANVTNYLSCLFTLDKNKCIFHKKLRNLMPRFTIYTYIFMYDNYAQKIEPIGLVAASASFGGYRPIEIDTAC